MLVLLGFVVVVVGFALRRNPMLVVTVAGLVTGLLGGMSPKAILDAFGTGFAGSRSIVIFPLVLPVIGLVERNSLQEHSRRPISRLARLTTGRVFALYLLLLLRYGLCSLLFDRQLARDMAHEHHRDGTKALPAADRERVGQR